MILSDSRERDLCPVRRPARLEIRAQCVGCDLPSAGSIGRSTEQGQGEPTRQRRRSRIDNPARWRERPRRRTCHRRADTRRDQYARGHRPSDQCHDRKTDELLGLHGRSIERATNRSLTPLHCGTAGGLEPFALPLGVLAQQHPATSVGRAAGRITDVARGDEQEIRPSENRDEENRERRQPSATSEPRERLSQRERKQWGKYQQVPLRRFTDAVADPLPVGAWKQVLGATNCEQQAADQTDAENEDRGTDDDGNANRCDGRRVGGDAPSLYRQSARRCRDRQRAGAELAERSGFGLGGSDLLAVSGVLAKSALSPTAGEVEPGGRKREKNEAGEPKQPVGRFALREPDATG